MDNIAVVVFDAVGTLIHPEPPAAVAYHEIGRRYGSRLGADLVADRFRAAFARQEAFDRDRGLKTSEARECERWRNIVTEVLDDVNDPETCFQELFEHFGRPGSWRCDAGAGATLASLAERGYTLCMASNYDQRLRSVVAGLPPVRLVRQLIISSEVGWRKPAGEFFQALCRCAGRPAKDILFVGDDPANDYDGARSAGMHAVLFDPHQKEKTPAVPRISRLAELLPLL